jgi:hypothetical protein
MCGLAIQTLNFEHCKAKKPSERVPRKRCAVHTIGSTGSCLRLSEVSTIDVSVSAPLLREERVGAIVNDFDPKEGKNCKMDPYVVENKVTTVGK